MHASILDLPPFLRSSRTFRSRRRSPWVLPLGLVLGAIVSTASPDEADEDQSSVIGNRKDDASTSAAADDDASARDEVAAREAFVAFGVDDGMPDSGTVLSPVDPATDV